MTTHIRMILAYALVLGGCVRPEPLTYDKGQVVPTPILEHVCNYVTQRDFNWGSDGNLPTHWNGHARWLVNQKNEITGLICEYTGFQSGWPLTYEKVIREEDDAFLPIDNYFDKVEHRENE
jgi:hypothetical protein